MFENILPNLLNHIKEENTHSFSAEIAKKKFPVFSNLEIRKSCN